ncbi:solute carrier family 2, facilitated glucose transporter member 1 isoform X2 [Tribolium castaneum]|uniref:solute carrier family 2, facilitated glucose transporter member 1 isoform X2 n=1 Tax=Tribolium castaneum TaxID=7070 RepID=UPI0030FE79A8
MSICNRFLLAVLVTSIGSGFHQGYHSGVLNVPAKVLQKWITHIKIEEEKAEEPKRRELSLLWSTTVASYSIGGIIGSFMIGIFADSLGRKQSLQYNNSMVFAAAAVMFFSKKAKSYIMLIMGRFIAGINSGLNMVSQIAGVLLGSEESWPYLFLLPIIPALFQLALLPFCPESPKFLITRLKDRKAHRALMLLRSQQDVVDEFEQMKEEDSLAKQLRGFTLTQIFKNPVMSNVLICCCIINVANQLSGKNALTYFSVQLLENLNMASSAVSITIGMSILSAIVALGIVFIIEYYGRRLLMEISLIGIILSTFSLFISLYFRVAFLENLKYLSVCFVCLFYVFFSIGLGPIPLFFTPELFSNSNRTVATCLASVSNWAASFVLGQAFLSLDNEIDFYDCLVFLFLDIFFFFYIRLRMPETAKLSSIQILKMYNIEE